MAVTIWSFIYQLISLLDFYTRKDCRASCSTPDTCMKAQMITQQNVNILEIGIK